MISILVDMVSIMSTSFSCILIFGQFLIFFSSAGCTLNKSWNCTINELPDIPIAFPAKYKGCYNTTGVHANITEDLETEDVLVCSLYCASKLFFMIEEKKCKCLESKVTSGEITTNSSYPCSQNTRQYQNMVYETISDISNEIGINTTSLNLSCHTEEKSAREVVVKCNSKDKSCCIHETRTLRIPSGRIFCPVTEKDITATSTVEDVETSSYWNATTANGPVTTAYTTYTEETLVTSDSTIIYHVETTLIGDKTTEVETEATTNKDGEIVYYMQIGLVLAMASLVLVVVFVAICVRLQKSRGHYSFKVCNNVEKEAMKSQTEQTQSPVVMATNYAIPKTLSTTIPEENIQSNKPVSLEPSTNIRIDSAIYSVPLEISGNTAPETCPSEKKSTEADNSNGTNCSEEKSEYNHLDFTLRSESSNRFLSEGEYGYVRQKVASVHEQPWDTKTSKLNKVFINLRNNITEGARSVRNSFFKRESVPPKQPSTKRPGDYIDDWQPPFAREASPEQENGTILDEVLEMELLNIISPQNSLKESDKNFGDFPVLPFSERLNVECENIYSEPENSRISVRDRSSLFVGNPIKMPFCKDLDFRRSSKSASNGRYKIYSMAKPVPEKTEENDV